MHILIVTSCTSDKTVEHERALTREDFEQGRDHVASRERELPGLLTDAERLYAGQQHARLMRGVRAFREQYPPRGGHSLDLWILSAGYGLVPGSRKLAPYECTFKGMKKQELRQWAEHLNVPADIRDVLAKPYDLGLVLLGDDYLKACSLDETVQLGGHTVLFCGKGSAKLLPKIDRLHVVVLTPADARRFSANLIGLKGELGARILERLAADAEEIGTLQDPTANMLALLDDGQSLRPPPRHARLNPDVNWTIQTPDSWLQRAHRQHLLYYIPDKDDMVDPDYDFETETHSGGIGDWSNEVFAHQLYREPNYDGILVSKSSRNRERKKVRRVDELGIHAYLRVPPDLPVMADCGAFSYINEDVPPYTTDEILDYYTHCGFDYGISLDHITIGDEEQKRARYELTLRNAREFLAKHRARGLEWTPVGAVQGWDPATYAEAASQYVDWGYRYLALGSLVRAKTPQILSVLEAVQRALPKDKEVKIHLLGVARLDAIREFVRLGATSVDSASYLRAAWASSTRNILTMEGWYSAIRIPQSDGSYRAKRIMDQGLRSAPQLRELEGFCLREIRRYASGRGDPPSDLLDALTEYDVLVVGRDGAKDPLRARARIERTLQGRPWEKCDCAICRTWGVEVAIFRGNNRNRRRGFHNTYVFFKLLDKLFEENPPEQLRLFR